MYFTPVASARAYWPSRLSNTAVAVAYDAPSSSANEGTSVHVLRIVSARAMPHRSGSCPRSYMFVVGSSAPRPDASSSVPYARPGWAAWRASSSARSASGAYPYEIAQRS
jgi:hypothetical protein